MNEAEKNGKVVIGYRRAGRERFTFRSATLLQPSFLVFLWLDRLLAY